jgi:hypothetical protein
MTAAMWKMQVERMREIRRQRGQPALAASDERTILEYLTRHAG